MKPIAIVFLLTLAATAQTRTFRWDDALCSYTGTYDPKKISKTQLANTWRLAETAGSIPLSTNTVAWKITDIEKLDVGALDREYETKLAALKALDIVKTPYWERFRQDKIREMEQNYQLSRIAMRAYRDPGVLVEYKGAPACSTKYAVPIAKGGDDLLNIWRTVSEDSRKNNGDPERLRRIFEEQMRSPDRLKYALIEALTFGWFNCANKFIDYVPGDERPAKEFKKLFKRARQISCEEP